jgi:2-oxoglutarate ferredoxin oxidoreductase subunit alpha
MNGTSVSVALAGSGGAGVMTAGNMLLEAAAQAGYYSLMTRTSGPQIRGGEAAAMVRVCTFPTDAQDDRFAVLAAIDWQNVSRFAAELPLAAGSLVIGDPAKGEPPEAFLKSGARYLPLPLHALAKQVGGGWPNMVALGVLAGLMRLPADAVDRAIAKSMKKGGEKRCEAGIAAAQLGMSQVASLKEYYLEKPQSKKGKRWLISGNEAAGLGALRGGVRFVAAYPITPATELLEYMAPALAQLGGTLVQAEDELASINMILGASYGGVPSLTATSGPGLSLMIEALGLGVTAEIPVVVVDVMRTGPSTGIATKSEQADLNIAMYGLHGDAPHVVVAPNSLADCLPATEWAVQLAESLQVPAIVLSDQYFGQARAVVDAPALKEKVLERTKAKEGEPYKRYALTESGVSPMALPGTPGLAYTADGLEHNERGIPSSQASDHLAQMDKRARKLARLDPGEYWASVEGEGDIAVLTFGSCTGPVREAFARARAGGVDARLVSLRLLSPVQPERLKRALAGVKRVLVVEQNHSGQFLRYLRSEYDLPGEVSSLRRPGPLPFRPDEIHRRLLEWGRT